MKHLTFCHILVVTIYNSSRRSERKEKRIVSKRDLFYLHHPGHSMTLHLFLSQTFSSVSSINFEVKISSKKATSYNLYKNRISDTYFSSDITVSLQVHAQLSFHGHRDSVKFFLAVPGTSRNIDAAKAYSMAGARPPSPSNVGPAIAKEEKLNKLIMSGGEGL